MAATVFVFGSDPAACDRVRRDLEDQQPPPDLDLRIRSAVLPPGDAAGRNRAVAGSKGSYVAMVEVDLGAVPGSRWLHHAIEVMRDDPTLGAVSLEAEGTQPGLRIDPTPAALLVRRTAWEAVGGYDKLVSLDAHGLHLGWRTWMLGWRVTGTTVDGSTVPDPAPVRADDLERICAKLLHDPVTQRRAARRVALDGTSGPSRRALQRRRRRSDGELGGLLREALGRSDHLRALTSVLEAMHAEHILGDRRRVVVATADTLASTMAGPGIRAWRIAGALAAAHDVNLVTTGHCDLTDPRFGISHVDDRRLAELVDGADVVIFQGWVMANRPWLADADVTMVVDIYDPMHLEQLEQGRDAPVEGGRWNAVSGANEILNQQLRRGDYFLCASAKQRDFWLGQMAAVGRLNLVLYDEDNALRDRMRVVPFGIEDEPPERRDGALRGVVPGIGPDDEVIIWGGGIYNWFDPITLVRAVDRLRHRRPHIRLYFLGTKHPNPEIPEMRMAVAARRLARDLGLLGVHVFFNDSWVAFDERARYLLDADVAVSIHKEHIETEFSFRTRILDYLWCSLPIVATSGDSFADLIRRDGLGIVVAPGDVDGLEAALEQLLADDVLRREISRRCEAFAEQFRWSDVLQPLVEVCRAPTRAPDVACPDLSVHYGIFSSNVSWWREDIALVRTYLREGGLSLVLSRIRSRIERLRTEGA